MDGWCKIERIDESTNVSGLLHSHAVRIPLAFIILRLSTYLCRDLIMHGFEKPYKFILIVYRILCFRLATIRIFTFENNIFWRCIVGFVEGLWNISPVYGILLWIWIYLPLYMKSSHFGCRCVIDRFLCNPRNYLKTYSDFPHFLLLFGEVCAFCFCTLKDRVLVSFVYYCPLWHPFTVTHI